METFDDISCEEYNSVYEEFQEFQEWMRAVEAAEIDQVNVELRILASR